MFRKPINPSLPVPLRHKTDIVPPTPKKKAREQPVQFNVATIDISCLLDYCDESGCGR